MAKYKQECIFGIRAVVEAIRQEKEIDKVYMLKDAGGELFRKMFALIREKNIAYQYVPADFFKSFGNKNHQGVVAEVSPIAYADMDEILDKAEQEGRMPFILILDRITDVRNFGAIVRTAACAGADAVVIPNKNSAKISSDAIKTSAGALYHLPVCRIPNLRKLVRTLKFERGISVYAASEKSDETYTQADMNRPLAIVMGSEDKGVEESLAALCNRCIKIPQRGGVESLNVSAAAAVLMFEVVRQRDERM